MKGNQKSKQWMNSERTLDEQWMRYVLDRLARTVDEHWMNTGRDSGMKGTVDVDRKSRPEILDEVISARAFFLCFCFCFIFHRALPTVTARERCRRSLSRAHPSALECTPDKPPGMKG